MSTRRSDRCILNDEPLGQASRGAESGSTVGPTCAGGMIRGTDLSGLSPTRRVFEEEQTDAGCGLLGKARGRHAR
ncbi:MAG: hypothetical protein ACK6DS_11120, partial [Planctomycetota bacterium]